MMDRDFQEHQNLSQMAVDMSAATIKGLLLINGAAAVAVLGFAGNLIESGLVSPQAVAIPVIYFAWGVALAVLTFAAAYATQYCLAASINHSSGWNKANIFFHVVAVCTAAASLTIFLAGSYSVKSALVFSG